MGKATFADKVKYIIVKIYIFLPLILIGFGVYFFYYGFFIRNKINKTYDEISNINYMIKSKMNKFKSFDNSIVLGSDMLPVDFRLFMDSQKLQGNMIPNRFGGRIFFYEAFNTMQERELFLANFSNQEKYKSVYEGTSAYLILLTQLSRHECRQLAAQDWKRKNANFVGLEASYMTPVASHNGISNLKYRFLTDEPENDTTNIKITDEGIISKTPMEKNMSSQACKCIKSNCTIALKFN